MNWKTMIFYIFHSTMLEVVFKHNNSLLRVFLFITMLLWKQNTHSVKTQVGHDVEDF